MTTRMLIDARHREETRVAVVKGNRIEEFDFESAERKQLRGNIYLAKVTRVEPSLQAAFVDYGGNRHGFLAFSEIHPDYYQIPKEDREALLAEADEEVEAEEEDEEEEIAAEAEAAEASEDGEVADGEDAGESEETEAVEETAKPRKAAAAAREDDSSPDEDERIENRRKAVFQRRYKIQEVIRRRQVMLVQVVKEERGN